MPLKWLPDGRFHALGGGIDGFSVAQFPAFVPSLAVIANVFFPAEECGGKYSLRVAATRPNGTDLGLSVGLELDPVAPPQFAHLGAKMKLAINLFSLLLTEEGTYVLSFSVRDQVVGTLEFNVALVPQAVAAGGQT